MPLGLLIGLVTAWCFEVLGRLSQLTWLLDASLTQLFDRAAASARLRHYIYRQASRQRDAAINYHHSPNMLICIV